MFVLLVIGSLAPLVIPVLMRTEGWQPAIAWVLVGGSVFLCVYALTLLPTRLTISDEGVRQKLIFSESTLRWEDMVKWRYCAGGPEYEEHEMRAQTRNEWHSIEFWIKDRTGRNHHFKRWLVFGRRSKQFADSLRE